jgi:hypothetical protein
MKLKYALTRSGAKIANNMIATAGNVRRKIVFLSSNRDLTRQTSQNQKADAPRRHVLDIEVTAKNFSF